jgi:uncharacterized protein
VQLLNGRLLFSPSDLVGYVACEHLTNLDLQAARGAVPRPSRTDPELEILRRRGLRHEREHLERLRTAGGVVEIPEPGSSLERIEHAAARTLHAMKEGAGVIYQAVLFDGQWLGYADFLYRVDRRSDLGAWSYEPADTKLKRSVIPGALLQLCAYGDLVTRLQGVPPDRIRIILGNGEERIFPLRDFAAYYRTVRHRFERAVEHGLGATYPHPIEHCSICRWMEDCQAKLRADDHLSLVANVRRDQIGKLEGAGIRTMKALADAGPTLAVARIGSAVLERLRRQARLQDRARGGGPPAYEFLDHAPERGLAALPPPSPGDLFFDIEADPWVAGGGLEYLFGILELEGSDPRFRPFWAHDRTEEKRAFEEVVDFFTERLTRDPGLHIYHYAPYEPTALKRLMGRHATREREVDRLLRGDVFVDLLRVVRQGLLISQDSYSLKKLEPLYMPSRTDAVLEAGESVVKYEEWIESGERRLLEEIRDYNETDCRSAWMLREWLEARREELETRYGVSLGRPEPSSPDPGAGQAAAEAETAVLVAGLCENLPEDAAERTREEQARWLLAQLLEWHRREARSEWWEYFERLKLSDEQLVEDRGAIGQLSPEGECGTILRSKIYRFRFDPQDNRILPGNDVVDPRSEAVVGKVYRIDNDVGILELKRASWQPAPSPRSVIPQRPYGTPEQRKALARLATWVLANDIAAPGPWKAGRDLLLGEPPRVSGAYAGAPLLGGSHAGADPDATEPLVEGATDPALRLADGYLPIQGPPGSGKTYTAARMVLASIGAGHVVGITAPSHKVITNLLNEVCRLAAGSGVQVRAIQKAKEDEACTSDGVERTESNGDVDAALAEQRVNVVAGTAWLFARQALEARLHTLFIDEAAQMSLANVIAVSGAARNLVLVGDPQQLAQPSKGMHPPGAEASALEHVLAGRATLPPEAGLFLPATRRLHPAICRFTSEIFYEGKLDSLPFCARQAVGGKDELSGSGLRFLPVEHAGDRTRSPEEAEAVATLAARLLGRTWTDRELRTRPLESRDVLVVAPFNAQVAELRRRLPPGVPVGTVDKFQGQEGVVSIYSMATSSGEDLPREMEFLYSPNRLNVATSRARALTILVCSPRLLEVRCRTPDQMRLVNALCRLVEMSSRITVATTAGVAAA